MKTNQFYTGIQVLAVMFLLAGCYSDDMSDLYEYKETVLARSPEPLEPIPELKLPETYEFQGGRDPFVPFYVNPKIPRKKAGWPGLTPEQISEITQRNPEELEKFELDSLRMVGTMNDEIHQWGLVLDPTGAVHQVRAGDYIGLNTGKILYIDETRIELRELVELKEGDWGERMASIALVEG